jgi:hypothetical protein
MVGLAFIELFVDRLDKYKVSWSFELETLDFNALS